MKNHYTWDTEKGGHTSSMLRSPSMNQNSPRSSHLELDTGLSCLELLNFVAFGVRNLPARFRMFILARRIFLSCDFAIRVDEN